MYLLKLLTDQQHFGAPSKSNKFAILVHFIYFVEDANRSAGEKAYCFAS